MMITKCKKYIRSELTGWSKFDLAWILSETVIILGLSLYWNDSLIGIVAAVTGVWCVILTGKGKRSTFIVGIVNVLAYAYVSFGAKYYGEVMLNILYYLPMNFVGWYVWSKHMDETTGAVKKNRLSLKRSMTVYGMTAVGVVVYGMILKVIGGNLPYVDSLTTVVSITAQILAVWRLKEQWMLWIVVNTVSVIMWSTNFIKGQGDISILVMWIMYLINGIILYIRWNKETKCEE